jgi:flagellin
MTINNNTLHDISRFSGVNSSKIEKLSSAMSLNKASDNASSLAIADSLRTQNSGITQSIENVTSAIALTNIAQSSLSEQKDILADIKTEALKANNGTTSEEGREAIAKKIEKMLTQYDNIASQTNYNGRSLLNSSGTAPVDSISISSEGGSVDIPVVDRTEVSDEISSLMSSFSTDSSARAELLDRLDSAISEISTYESSFGSASNQLSSMAKNYMSSSSNISNAESAIRDLDFSKGIEELKKSDLSTQIENIVQSQANTSQERVLMLLT